MILLDTCSFIWLVNDPKKLSEAVFSFLENTQEAIFISAISAFEIALLSKKNQIVLPLEALDWFQQSINYYQIIEIEINSEIAIVSTRLKDIHKDPADRIIIATALINNLKIIIISLGNLNLEMKL